MTLLTMVGLCVALVLPIFQVASPQQPPTPALQTPAFQAASVVVRFPAGKTAYYIGEEIPLELEFRGRASEDFYFSTDWRATVLAEYEARWQKARTKR